MTGFTRSRSCCQALRSPPGLICNDPLAYADLVLTGDVEGYLKRVTQYRPMDEKRG